MANEDRPATIYDVAREAGVSIASVSRALQDSPLVAPATKERIRLVADRLHFRPSHAGRQLARGLSMAMGIVFPDLTGPYYAGVVQGFEDTVAMNGWGVLILSAHGRANAERLALDLADRVDGIVVMGRTISDAGLSAIAAQKPVVLLAREPYEELDTVRADNADGVRQLGDHLLEHGFRRVTFLGDPALAPDVAQRHQALRSLLTEHGRRAPRLVRCALTLPAGVEAGRAVLTAQRLPEIVVCANDELALGVLTAAAGLGMSIPGDVALTGWDDIDGAAAAGLTTVRQPIADLGRNAATLLRQRILGRRFRAPRRLSLPTELEIRHSCGCTP